MAQRYTVEQLKTRQAKLQREAHQRQKKTAALRHRLERELAAAEAAQYAALGRAVAASVGVTTPEAWAAWYAHLSPAEALATPDTRSQTAAGRGAHPGHHPSDVHFPVSPVGETAPPR